MQEGFDGWLRLAALHQRLAQAGRDLRVAERGGAQEPLDRRQAHAAEALRRDAAELAARCFDPEGPVTVGDAGVALAQNRKLALLTAQLAGERDEFL